MKKGHLSALAAALIFGATAQAQTTLLDSRVVFQAPEADKTATIMDAAPVSGALCCAPSCDPGPRFWISTDYLMWWIKSGPNVPLVGTGNIISSPSGAGADLTNERVLFGNDNLHYGDHNGGRITAGMQLNSGIGIEGSYFLLERRSDGYSNASDANGNPELVRPFFDTYAAFPAVVPFVFVITNSNPTEARSTGYIDIQSHSRLQGADLNAVFNLQRRNNFNVDFLVGFRYLDLAEDLSIVEGVTPIDPVEYNGILTTDPFTVNDRFSTVNHFYGAQIGAKVNGPISASGRATIGMTAKVAFGWTDQSVNIDGFSTQFPPGAAPIVSPGGVLALPGNIGSYHQNHFAVVPELGVNFGYQITPNLKANVGYTFMYWSSVVRPGNQIDQTIDQTLSPSSSFSGITTGPHDRPRFGFNESDFWAQGINLGLTFSY